MAKSDTAPATIESLMTKGDGVLIKRGTVWTYPGAPIDPSGTNLRLPVESVAHSLVQDAIEKGSLVPRAVDSSGFPTSVGRAPAEGEAPIRIVNMALAGTSDLGTELPLNSRPTHDAGRRPDDAPLVFQDPQASVKHPAPVVPVTPAAETPAVVTK